VLYTVLSVQFFSVEGSGPICYSTTKGTAVFYSPSLDVNTDENKILQGVG